MRIKDDVKQPKSHGKMLEFPCNKFGVKKKKKKKRRTFTNKAKISFFKATQIKRKLASGLGWTQGSPAVISRTKQEPHQTRLSTLFFDVWTHFTLKLMAKFQFHSRDFVFFFFYIILYSPKFQPQPPRLYPRFGDLEKEREIVSSFRLLF